MTKAQYLYVFQKIDKKTGFKETLTSHMSSVKGWKLIKKIKIN